MKTVSTLFSAICLTLTFSVALADDQFYCGAHIVKRGDSKAKVESECGEPSVKSYDTWTYNRGTNEFIITLHFNPDGTLTRIEQTDPNS